MYCSSCGIAVSDSFRYCPQCGTVTSRETAVSQPAPNGRALSRPREHRKVAGVASGVARYLGVDVTLVRLLMILFALWPPFIGLAVYLICWIVMPPDRVMLMPPQMGREQDRLALRSY